MGQTYFGDKTNLDPEGWIKYASDSDPWNENLYSQFADENGALRYGILTLEEISKRSSNLIQLPDNKAFVFSRLHINKMVNMITTDPALSFLKVECNFLYISI